MSRLPKLPRDRTPPALKRRLARWLAEWNVYLTLRSVEAEREAADGAPVQPMPRRMPSTEGRDMDGRPAEGDVRLMHPAGSAGAAGPAYIAVLSAAEGGRLVIMPFGRFAEPAVPDELRTRRHEPFLRVLQFGRAAALPADLVARSWRITALSPADLQDARAALASTRAGSRVSGRLALRTGPALWSLLDPRHEYLEEEAERLRFLRSERAEWLARDESPPTWGGFAARGENPRLAAEDRDRFTDEP